MKIIMFVVPSFLILICLRIYMKFYKLNGDFMNNTLIEIEKIRNSTNNKK